MRRDQNYIEDEDEDEEDKEEEVERSGMRRAPVGLSSSSISR